MLDLDISEGLPISELVFTIAEAVLIVFVVKAPARIWAGRYHRRGRAGLALLRAVVPGHLRGPAHLRAGRYHRRCELDRAISESLPISELVVTIAEAELDLPMSELWIPSPRQVRPGHFRGPAHLRSGRPHLRGRVGLARVRDGRSRRGGELDLAISVGLPIVESLDVAEAEDAQLSTVEVPEVAEAFSFRVNVAETQENQPPTFSQKPEGLVLAAFSVPIAPQTPRRIGVTVCVWAAISTPDDATLKTVEVQEVADADDAKLGTVEA